MSQDPNHSGVTVSSSDVKGHSDRDDGGSIHHTTYGDGWHVSWNEDKSSGDIGAVHTTVQSGPSGHNTVNTDPDTINSGYEQ